MKIDNESIKEVGEQLELLADHITELKDELLDESLSLFTRFWACRSAMNLIKTVNYASSSFKNAVQTGHDIHADVFDKEELAKNGWDKYLVNPGPFFIDETEKDKPSSYIDEFLRKMLGVSGKDSSSKPSEHNKAVAEKIMKDLESGEATGGNNE